MKSAAAWRRYRTLQVDFEARPFAGGSIQPTVRNAAFAAITPKRLESLGKLTELGDVPGFPGVEPLALETK